MPSISERAARVLLQLFPIAQGRPDAEAWLVDQLVDAELHRRGQPDATGAFHALALREGSLLKEEYDLSTHGHADGWVLGAVLVDPRELMVFNMHHGFPAGDAALRLLVRCLQSVFPTGKVVRTHTDGFAVLLGPTSDRRVEPALEPVVRQALRAALPSLEFTVGLLELTVVEPSTWQVLGPLVWAEAERALVIARRAGTPEVLRRRFDLHGRLPELG